MHLLRVTAQIFRFFHRTHKGKLRFPNEFLSSIELSQAKTALVKYVQRTHFSEEISALQNCQPIDKKSSLISLNENGVLVVHGRLQYANFSENHRFPLYMVQSI